MERAPYPDLAPDLWDIVRGLQVDGPAVQQVPSVADMRAQLNALAARNPLVPPVGLKTRDWTMDVSGRAVRLRAYLPAETGPDALLYMHGGGWMLGSIEGHDQVCADLAHATGLRVVSIDYALAPEHRYPVALEECLAAFTQLRDGSSPIGPVRDLWLGGDSAGGNLGLATALRLRDEDLQQAAGMFLIYPCTNPACAFPSYTAHANAPFLTTALMHRFWREYLGPTKPDPYAAPALAGLSGLPQTVLLTATLDPLIDEGNALAQGLGAAGVNLHYTRADHLIHGFLRFRHASPIAETAFQTAASAISERLR